MEELDITAAKENLPQVLGFVGSRLDEVKCADKVRMQIEIAVEEVFVNIASYAYDPEAGSGSEKTLRGAEKWRSRHIHDQEEYG